MDMKQVYTFTLLDPADLLPRVKAKSLKVRRKEIEEVRDFTLSFMTVLHKKKIHFQYLSQEDSEHELSFLAKNGIIEFFFYPPVIIRAHFTNKKDAEFYARELKAFLKKEINDPKIDILLESLVVTKKNSILEPAIRCELHKLYFKKGLAYTSVALAVVLFIEILSKASEEFLIHYFHLETIGISLFAIKVIFGTILVAIVLEPLKEKVEAMIEKYLP